MFNHRDPTYDIAAEMERLMYTKAADEANQPITKLAAAIEQLASAAETFDSLGLTLEAEAATRLLECLAAKRSKKKPSAKPSKSKTKPAAKPTAKPSKGKSKPKASKRPAGKKDPATDGLDSETMIENLKGKGWVFNADDGQPDVNDISEGTKGIDAHPEGCDCQMCGDSGVLDQMMVDDSSGDDSSDADDHEAELARIMGELTSPEQQHADEPGHEATANPHDESEGDFEDDAEDLPLEERPLEQIRHIASDFSRAMRFIQR